MIVITGATGFIGRRVVPLFAKNSPNQEIVCFVKNHLNPWEQKAEEVIRRLKLKMIRGNLVSGEGLNQLPLSPGLVIHLAAVTDTSESNYQCNDLGTKNLYKSLGKLGSRNHLIYTSTTAVMAGRNNCSLPFDENSQPKPTNEYGRSKLNAEKFLIEKCKKDKFRLTIVRLTTVYGSDPRKNSLFDMMKNLAIKKSLLSRFNWPGLTGLVHVDDVASWIFKLSKKPPKPGEVDLYIFNSELITLAQISKEVHRKLNLEYRAINLPNFFWRLAAASRPSIYSLEKFLPSSIYNLLWRASLIVDNVIYCKNDKVKNIFLNSKPHLLKDSLEI